MQENEKKYRLLLGVRSRIEYLEELFNPNHSLTKGKKPRIDTWLTILDLCTHRLINDLKVKIRNSGLTDQEFCESVGVLYGDFNDRAAHRVPRPREIKNKNIDEVMELLEVQEDEPVGLTLNIIIKPLKIIPAPEALNETSSSDSVVHFKRENESNDSS